MKFELKQAFYMFYVAFFATTVACVLAGFFLGYVDAWVLGFFASVALMCLFPFLQLFWFTPAVIKRWGYGARIAGFGLTYLPILVGAALLGRWFEPSLGTWAIFLGIYLVILTSMSLGFHLYYKRVSGSYQAALERYRAQGEKDGE